MRFELGVYALDPDLRVIAPWREWDLNSRTKLIAYAERHGIQVAKDKRGEAPFSVDANLWHTSSEGKVLENPAEEARTSFSSARSTRSMHRTRRNMSRSASSAAMRRR